MDSVLTTLILTGSRLIATDWFPLPASFAGHQGVIELTESSRWLAISLAQVVDREGVTWAALRNRESILSFVAFGRVPAEFSHGDGWQGSRLGYEPSQYLALVAAARSGDLESLLAVVSAGLDRKRHALKG